MKSKTETVSVWYINTEHAAHVQALPLHALAFDRLDSTMETVGWLKAGTAEITVTYLPNDQHVEKAAAGIRQQMADAAAQYQALQTELQARLNSLLAITNEVEA